MSAVLPLCFAADVIWPVIEITISKLQEVQELSNPSWIARGSIPSPPNRFLSGRSD